MDAGDYGPTSHDARRQTSLALGLATLRPPLYLGLRDQIRNDGGGPLGSPDVAGATADAATVPPQLSLTHSSVMNSTAPLRPVVVVALALLALACGRSDTDHARGDAAAIESGSAAPASGGADAVFAFTEADLDAYERGMAKEIELVRAAQERQRAATTPEARGEAIQAQWADQTIPEGARSAGLPADRYRKVRETVNRTLETLDFQGKIEGPMTMDTAHAPPDMRRRLESDPFAALPAASAAALRARVDRLAPIFVRYVELTAVAG